VIDAVYRAESRRVLATLIRLLGGFELAEEAPHEAFAAAVERHNDSRLTILCPLQESKHDAEQPHR
jgi:predicted RNA polymerase sigma factor